MNDANRLAKVTSELQQLTAELDSLQTAPLPLREVNEKLDAVIQLASHIWDDQPLIADLFDPNTTAEQIVERHASVLFGSPADQELMTVPMLYAARDQLRDALTNAATRHAPHTEPGPPRHERQERIRRTQERIDELHAIAVGLTAQQ